jgi:uncharacterized protein
MEAPDGFRYIDIHTHLHPERLSRAIRRWFAERSTWKLEYPSEPEGVASFLAERGVERFVYFSYAHKAGMAREINAWLHGVRPRAPAGIPLGTIHPDDPDMMDVAEEAPVGYGFGGFKFHINVQRFFPDDARVRPVYERLLALDRLLLIHVGSAPWPNEFDGFPRFARVMERCPNLYLDTTMAFAPIHHEYRKIDTRLNRISVTNDDLLEWQDRIVFGSDFPILPYPYEEEREALWLRDLPLPVYRKIFHDNAARILGIA